MNLYDQLLSLQDMKAAYLEWQDYRSTLTNYILEHTSSHESIALLGAGRCNDIDLCALSKHFKHITLIDRDLSALKEALDRYNLTSASHIHLKQVDFVGITPHMYRAYADTLIHEVRKKGMQTNVHELSKFAIATLAKMFHHAQQTPLDLGTTCYQNTVMIGVHSQLLSMVEWLWTIMLQTIKQNEESVRHYINEMNNFFIHRLHNALLQATQDTVILGMETERVGRPGPIQGALQGLNDIQKRYSDGALTLLDKTHLLWPFDTSQGITYTISIQTLKI